MLFEELLANSYVRTQIVVYTEGNVGIRSIYSSFLIEILQAHSYHFRYLTITISAPLRRAGQTFSTEGHIKNFIATWSRIYYTIVTSGWVKMRFRLKRVE